jgi:hypothetical protein
MVQHLLDHWQIDAEPRHAAGGAAPQIMESPRRHVSRQQRIEASLAFGVAARRRRAAGRKDLGALMNTRQGFSLSFHLNPIFMFEDDDDREILDAEVILDPKPE